MKRIAIFCVNYNSYEELSGYLDSLAVAVEEASKARKEVNLDVFVADNTERNPQSFAPNINSPSITYCLFPYHQNLGYFGAIGKMMKEVDVCPYDYVLVSNVDLTVAEDFFIKLAVYPCEETTGWIAPQIHSCYEKRDKNPGLVKRYSLRKLKMLKALYCFPKLKRLYTQTFYRLKKYQCHPAGQIYAGHGSMLILTQNYFRLCGKIDYPIFLFCEELYLAEQCLKAGLKVEYVPIVKVEDAEHVSTSRMDYRFYCRCNYEAISYIIKRFY